jgi:hypothetical protein
MQSIYPAMTLVESTFHAQLLPQKAFLYFRMSTPITQNQFTGNHFIKVLYHPQSFHHKPYIPSTTILA